MNLNQTPYRWLLLVAVAATLAGAGFVLFRAQRPVVPMVSSVQILPLDTGLNPRPPTWFERSVPRSWSWLWRLREAIYGTEPTILIDGMIVDCTRIAPQTMEYWLSGPAHVQSNGLRGWILNGGQMAQLRRKLQEREDVLKLSQPRVQSAHAIQSSLSVSGPNPSRPSSSFGVTVNLLPFIQRDGTELLSVITVTQTMTNPVSGAQGAAPTVEVGSRSGTAGGNLLVTNLAAAARWTLPDGMGFFLLGPTAPDASSGVGVVISATVQGRPK